MSATKTHFCIFGRKPIVEALRENKRFDKILIQKGIAGNEIAEVVSLAKQAETPVQMVPREKLDAVASKYSKFKEANHQGILGFLSLIDYYSIDDVISHVYDKGEAPLFVLLDGVTDVGNFGAIARSAECLGAHALIVPASGSAQINAQAMKASAGALNRIMVCREKSLLTAVKTLKANGLKIVSLDVTGNTYPDKTDFSIPCVIVMGAEGEGISKDILKQSDLKVKIPMSGETESLNVSVSAGIVLYEASKQRAIK